MQVYSTLCPDGSFHLFSQEEYAEKFSRHFGVHYKPINVDVPSDMEVVRNLSQWELYQFSRMSDLECGDGLDNLCVLAKDENHAKSILHKHGIAIHEYYNYTIELSNIRPGTTLDCLYNFDKKE